MQQSLFVGVGQKKGQFGYFSLFEKRILINKRDRLSAKSPV
ncbi:hypothetical protein PORCRE_807 [Porphyromonas crevioricanis JCM 15906]|uniref:Uncharacterized protein n=1 Tax=Porphyromonas crevioricanis JCM 15906 TaxID=1305617 RepID=T1DS32_9PORP|nr:hypothetical protein PORCRE_807 [Porphyromonas crevioricanis JCM 15906]